LCLVGGRQYFGMALRCRAAVDGERYRIFFALLFRRRAVQGDGRRHEGDGKRGRDTCAACVTHCLKLLDFKRDKCVANLE